MVEKCDQCNEENLSMFENCLQCRNENYSGARCEAVTSSKTSCSSNANPRMRVGQLWRNMLAVILISLMPDPDIQDSNKGPVVVNGARVSSAAARRTASSYYSNAEDYADETSNVEDEIPFLFDDEDIDFRLEFESERAHNVMKEAVIHDEESHDVWNLKSGEKGVTTTGNADISFSSKEVERYIFQRGTSDNAKDIILIATTPKTKHTRSPGQKGAQPSK